jgi:hypothetical protein
MSLYTSLFFVSARAGVDVQIDDTNHILGLMQGNR